MLVVSLLLGCVLFFFLRAKSLFNFTGFPLILVHEMFAVGLEWRWLSFIFDWLAVVSVILTDMAFFIVVFLVRGFAYWWSKKGLLFNVSSFKFYWIFTLTGLLRFNFNKRGMWKGRVEILGFCEILFLSLMLTVRRSCFFLVKKLLACYAFYSIRNLYWIFLEFILWRRGDLFWWKRGQGFLLPGLQFNESMLTGWNYLRLRKFWFGGVTSLLLLLLPYISLLYQRNFFSTIDYLTIVSYRFSSDPGKLVLFNKSYADTLFSGYYIKTYPQKFFFLSPKNVDIGSSFFFQNFRYLGAVLSILLLGVVALNWLVSLILNHFIWAGFIKQFLFVIRSFALVCFNCLKLVLVYFGAFLAGGLVVCAVSNKVFLVYFLLKIFFIFFYIAFLRRN